MGRDTFVFYREWLEGLEDFDIEFRWKILEAIFDYALNGNLPTDPSILYSPFAMIRKRIDKDNEKYQSVVLRNQINGVKGGRPRKEKPTKTQITQPNPKNPVGFEKPKKPTETQITQKTQPNPKNLDNDNDNDIVSEYKYSSTILSEPKGSLSSDKPDDEKKKKKDDECEYIHNIYNEAAARSNLKKSVKLTDSRKSLIKARLAEYDMQTIIDVINIAAESPWLNGDNDRGWRADADFVFNKSKFIKILEGSYNNAKQQYNPNNTTSGYTSPEDIERQQRTQEFMQHIIGKIGNDSLNDARSLW